MAINAYNAGTTNNLIDTTSKFVDGDMLVFDLTKNLFVKGITLQQLALKTDLVGLQNSIAGLTATVGNIGNVDLTPYATRDYVDGRFASFVDNDRQTLSLVGNTLSIQNGNSVDLSTVLQSLSLTGSVIGITEGNQIDIGPLIDEAIASANLTDQNGNSVDLSVYITESELNTALSNYQPTVDLTAYYTKNEVNALLPTVFSGSYNDLIDQPDLTQYVTNVSLQQTLNNYQPTIDLSSYYTKTEVNALIPVTFSGDYNDLTNTPDLSVYALKTEIPTIPTVPTDISQLTDLQGLLGQADLTGYATTAYVTNQLSAYQPLTDLTVYATKTYVDANTFSGSYNDLTDKPVMFSGNYNDLYNKPAIFSGNYNDLYNQPTIPSTDGLASISYVDQQIANVSSGGSVDLSSYVTETELTTALANYQPTIDLSNYATQTYVNDAIAEHATQTYVDTKFAQVTSFSGSYNDLTNKPAIPTDVSQLTDVSGLLGQGSVDLTNYYTKTQVDALITPHTVNTDSQTLSLTGNTLSISGGNSVDLSAFAGGGGNVDLTGYATQTYVNSQIAAATLAAGGISNLNDLNDVAIDGTETTNHVLMYNAVNQLWENVDLDETFATRTYVSEQVAQIVSGGQLDLSGYATESYVTQKLLERGDHFSGDYNDLSNTPILFSGDYRDLINTPADNSDLRLVLNGDLLQLMNIEPEPDTVISTIKLEDLGQAVSSYVNYQDVQNLPNIFSGDYNDLINRPNLFSGNYNDLRNKPYIPSIAGLATEQYVNDKHAEPTIYGDKTFKGSVTFENFILQKTSTVSHIAQKREYVMAIQTTNNIPTEVLLSNSSRIAIPQNSTAMFKATFVAVSSTTSASFNIRGVINHSAVGTTQLIGGNILEVIADGGTEWIGDITADSVTDSLKILITGEAATTIDWTVFVELTEVKR